MTNFYRDNADILFHLQNLDLTTIIKMREQNFSEKDKFKEAPADLKDALDNYDQVLDIVGEIAGEFVAPRAAEIDAVGAEFVAGEVKYAPGTLAAIDRLTKADLMGFTLPREFGGLNLPKVMYAMAIEIVSRADAALMNIFGLQEISETICNFGSAEQKSRFLPRFSRGEVLGAMALTEPDAGSDLQAVSLKASEHDGKWYLDGVKRFITNGCANISLVLARSEEGVSGGRGLSLFIYERDKNMRIRRIENKLGIHGSPTCEMQFNHAEAELIGQRRFGLIKYTMALMNGARLAVSAQALGIAEAAYREANAYASSRMQFGKPIRELTAVYEMLTEMKVAIEASRTFMYEAACMVDLKDGLEKIIEQNPERKDELKRFTKYAAFFTPAVKTHVTEMANKVCYDAIQVFGGSGFMQDFNVERHFRDVRVTNIYEGTTQLQVLAAIGGVISGVVFERLDEYEKKHDFSPVAILFEKAQNLRKILEVAVVHIKEKGDKSYQEYHERRCVEIANAVVISYLLCIDALKLDRKKIIAHLFIAKALPQAKCNLDYILSDDTSLLEYRDV
ncbi:MAG: acyl-CoA dehydrogenase family protein [Gammaproteobacteria bacterium]|nr:acyl-CoA dehydrogenase family protein [Gammaproteobacteria bacterium]